MKSKQTLFFLILNILMIFYISACVNLPIEKPNNLENQDFTEIDQEIEINDNHLETYYLDNPDLNEQFSDAILYNRNPDCRAYATDANSGNYSSLLITDNSNDKTDGVSNVIIELVIASGWNNDSFNYDYVEITTNPLEATHCRVISNMIPNHTFGVEVTGPRGDGWINPIDHTDVEMTYIPVDPIKTDIAKDTPRNPPIYDFDGILLNGVGTAC